MSDAIHTNGQDQDPDAAAFAEAVASLPEDLRSDPSLREVGTLADLTKSLVHAQRRLGEKAIDLPGENATPDEWKAHYQRLGAPETAAGYAPALADFTPPEGLPWQQELVPAMLETFAELGVLPHQARGIIEDYAALQQQALAAQAEQVAALQAQNMAALSREFGGDAGLAAASKAAHTAVRELFGGAKAAEAFATLVMADGRRVGDHPDVFRAFVKIGKNIQQHDRSPDSARGRATAARAELDRIMSDAYSDPRHPFMDASHPEHRRVVERVADLNDLLGSAEE